MAANADKLRGWWPALKSQVHQRWSRLTEDDIAMLGGKPDELAGALQQRYGYAKARAEMEINQWLYDYDKKNSGGSAAPNKS